MINTHKSEYGLKFKQFYIDSSIYSYSKFC